MAVASTDAQGSSGLGIEAQRKAVTDYLNGGSWTLAQEFIEVESGKRSDRLELAKAQEAQGQARRREARPAEPQRRIHLEADGIRRRVRRLRHAAREQAHGAHPGRRRRARA